MLHARSSLEQQASPVTGAHVVQVTHGWVMCRELEVESQRKEAMRLHQLHRERGASQFGLANAMGTYMQKMEEEVLAPMHASAAPLSFRASGCD